MIDLPPPIVCEAPRAIDGDGIRCANLPVGVRLIGIDAPELPGHCHRGRVCTPGDGFAARAAMAALLTRGRVTVSPVGFDRYGRILARVTVGRIDLSCRLIATGAAVRRYAPISC